MGGIVSINIFAFTSIEISRKVFVLNIKTNTYYFFFLLFFR